MSAWTVEITNAQRAQAGWVDLLWMAQLFNHQPGLIDVLPLPDRDATTYRGTAPGPLQEALVALQHGDLHQYRLDYEKQHGPLQGA
jgi:hypothetical protein